MLKGVQPFIIIQEKKLKLLGGSDMLDEGISLCSFEDESYSMSKSVMKLQFIGVFSWDKFLGSLSPIDL